MGARVGMGTRSILLPLSFWKSSTAVGMCVWWSSLKLVGGRFAKIDIFSY